jgi:hypothetical protein
VPCGVSLLTPQTIVSLWQTVKRQGAQNTKPT